MFKLNTLASAVALALVIPSAAFAEFEVSGEAKIEYGLFAEEGTVTGASAAHKSGDAMKTETSLKLFINSDVGEDSSFHAEVLLSNEGEAASKRLEGGEADGQYEVIREFFFDTEAAGWDFRLGKQQVVWGTADGIKLLDFINPTDFRELNQNAGEDSRIPVWMINAEKDLDSGANIQLILSESKANFISGLDKDSDSGAPFLFKGVDTITGKTNGFLNIATDMGKTSGVFQTLLAMGGLTNLKTGPMALTTVSQFTVLGTGAPNKSFTDVGGGLTAGTALGQVINADAFGNGSNIVQFSGPIIDGTTNEALLNVVFLPFMNQLVTGNEVLNQASNNAGGLLTSFGNYLVGLQTGAITPASIGSTGGEVTTALNDLGSQMGTAVYAGLTAQGVNVADSTQVAAALSGATGTTITSADVTGVTAAYQGAIQTVAIAGMSSTFFSNSTTNQFGGTLDTANPKSAFDYMGNTTFATFDGFIGMTTDYRNQHKDKSEQNFGFRYKDSTEGGTNFSLNYAYRMDSNPYIDMHWEDGTGDTLTVNKNVSSMDALGQPRDFDGNGTIDSPNPEAYTVTTLYMTKSDSSVFDSQSGANPAKLVMEEKLQRISTIGASFDTAIDTDVAPVVLRGELSYDIGTKVPVVDLDELSIGNLTGALKMEEANILKYVLGVDVTVLSNLLVSTQLIQMYNLDYVDSGNRYSGDFSTMHLTNGLNKGDEVETFVSFFLSKPFGDDGQHRWNNIIISENGGGYWNRFDIEYGINDEMVGTFEVNNYWGDENTTFGQFKTSSNVQLGLKYLF